MTDVLAERTEIDAQIAGRNIAYAFADTVARLGDAPAYSDKVGIEGAGWRTLSWNQLRDQALDVSAALIELGVEPGDRIAIMATNRIEHILADIGAMHAGATGMSIYNTLSPSQVAYVAEHSTPAVVILENADHVARWSEVAPSSVKKLVVIDPTAAPPGAITWDDLVKLGASVRAERQAEIDRRWQGISLDDPATILYTSGTTGNPKGVVITHHNVMFEVASTDITVGASKDEELVTVSYLPYAHIAERVLGIYLPQMMGAHLHLIADPAQLVGALGEVKPTRFFGVPRVWEKIQTGINGLLAMETDEAKKEAIAGAMAVGLEYVTSLEYGNTTSPELQARFDAVNAAVLTPMKSMLGLERVGWAGSASAPMPLETTRFFAGLGFSIYDIYGMTETCGAVTACGPGAFRMGTVGRAQPGLEVTLAPDGEILARGPVTTSGYHQNPEATAALIDADGWVHTGDIGEIDEDGFVKVVDRKKELIITSAGKNIAPSNIENMLKESPLVGHALAYGEGKPYVVAILTLDPDIAPVIAGKLGLEDTALASLAENPAILGIVGQAVEKANDRLSRPEQVKKWKLLPVEWTAESAELTPTLKLKRRVVHTNYADEIERLYND
ncbi:long-chain fatty acid--CoA ligase [Nocardioides marmoriginsengisoli]|uniref:Acyl-CoA synthetase n=1 Tax=Nocardioides marmoriginsengisoli TaxID=661483 RepID=A0A3N0CQZ7_9ACTN|nr:AMP-dependent synthetase/ligase [Nocardioides marmoriginsengisoli]RNL65456.1 long-chain fatty acid--CoA ligase [Nocardioides marmoriginsengisoli]